MKKLELFLKNNSYSEKKSEALYSLFSNAGEDELFFPLALSAKIGISIDDANKILLLLTVSNVLDVYTVPELNNRIVREELKKGIIQKAELFDVLDPQDFSQIDPSEFELITAYKKKESHAE